MDEIQNIRYTLKTITKQQLVDILVGGMKADHHGTTYNLAILHLKVEFSQTLDEFIEANPEYFI